MARKQETRYFLNACARALNVIEKMEKQKPKKLKEDIDDMARSIIARWYASYPSPIYYNRQRSLYHAYRLEQNGVDVEIIFEASNLKGHYHQSAEYVYDTVFIGGWHGGSVGTDSSGETVDEPTWRTPYPTPKNIKAGVQPYTRWSELEVPRDESLYEQILKGAEQLMQEYDEEWIRDLDAKVMAPIKKSLAGLKRK